MSLRILPRVSPRQSPSSAILFEMSSEAGWPWLVPVFFMVASWFKWRDCPGALAAQPLLFCADESEQHDQQPDRNHHHRADDDVANGPGAERYDESNDTLDGVAERRQQVFRRDVEE